MPAGRVCNKLLTNLDLLPAIAKVTRARLPKKQIDEVDALALLKGDETITPRDHFVYYYQKIAWKPSGKATGN